jgi:hypothetical protein
VSREQEGSEVCLRALSRHPSDGRVIDSDLDATAEDRTQKLPHNQSQLRALARRFHTFSSGLWRAGPQVMLCRDPPGTTASAAFWNGE